MKKVSIKHIVFYSLILIINAGLSWIFMLMLSFVSESVNGFAFCAVIILLSNIIFTIKPALRKDDNFLLYLLMMLLKISLHFVASVITIQALSIIQMFMN